LEFPNLDNLHTDSNKNKKDKNKNENENDSKITGEYPVLLNIAGEYILIHEQSKKFVSNEFSKIVGSMWVELKPKYNVDPTDTEKIIILRKTFGVLRLLQQPPIDTTMCEPEDKGFIVTMLKYRITTLKQEIPFLSPSLVKAKKEQQIKNLQNLIAMIDGLPPDAPKCKPVMPTSYKIPSLLKNCDEEIEIIKKLLELIKSLHGEDIEDLEEEVEDEAEAEEATVEAEVTPKRAPAAPAPAKAAKAPATVAPAGPAALRAPQAPLAKPAAEAGHHQSGFFFPAMASLKSA
jgi:hypothetical protein